jgi:hypothetical protein
MRDAMSELQTRRFRRTQQRLCVPRAQTPIRNHRFDRFRQREQTQRVGNGGARLAQPLRNLFLREIVRFDQLRHAGGFFERIEIVALQILDNRNFQTLQVGTRPHDRGNAGPLQHRAGAPAAFSRDELVPLAALAHENRHEHAMLDDRGLEFVHGRRVEVFARLMRVRTHSLYRNLPDDLGGRSGRRNGNRRLAEQGT